MGLTRDFFTSPILVPVTLRRTVEKEGGFETVDYQVIFKMNRESVADKNNLAISASLFDSQNNLARFCKQLDTEPKGIEDFPTGDKPLQERALEYFAPEGYADLIQYVLMEVERAQKPLEFFRGV